MSRLLAALVVTSIVGPPMSSAVAAQDPRPVTVDDIMALKTVMDPQISPDGSQILYVVSVPVVEENSHNSDIWLASDDGSEPIQLTFSPKMDQSPRWSPDGRMIAFLSAREGAPQIYLLHVAGGEARQLTTGETGVTDFAWAPAGDRIAFRSADPKTEEQKNAEEENGDVQVVDGSFTMTHLHTIDVASGDTQRVTGGDFTVGTFSWSPDGNRIAFARQPTPRVPDGRHSDIYIAPADSGALTALVERRGPDNSPAWSPDGQSIAFISANESLDQINHPALFIVPASGGTPRALGTAHEESVNGMVWTPDSRRLLMASFDRVTQRLFSVDVSSGAVEPLSPADGVYASLTISRDGRRGAFLKSDPSMPPEVHTSSSEPFDARRLTHSNPQLADLALGDMEVIRWNAPDGMEIEGLLLKPVGYQEGVRYPLLTYVHGGPSGLFMLGFLPQLGSFPIPLQSGPYPIQAFAGEGFAVLMPNPRGSSGYGRDFLRANIKDWGHGDYRDIQSGIDHLIERGIADPSHLGIMGWSYGGYMTSWTISQTDRFRAASVGAGLPNMFSMHGNTDISDVLLDYFGDRPWNDPDMYIRSSAMFHAQNIVTPTLIQHGENDERVLVSQGWELYRALQANDVPVEFAIYPRQGHLLAEPKLQRDALKRNLEWFRRWVRREISRR